MGGGGHPDKISIWICLHNNLHRHVHIYNNIWLVKQKQIYCGTLKGNHYLLRG